MENFINKDYYLPLLKEFCDKALPLYECGYPQGPFIPFVMPNYMTAPVRILYVGQDTREWTRYNVLKDAYEIDHLVDYLNANKSNVYVEKMLEWNNNSRAFWPFANQLHLLIRTGEYISDLSTINDDQKKLLGEMGYGNIFSIEIPKSLERIDSYEDVPVQELISNMEQYNSIREAAKPFEKIKTMIEAYRPDFIFILSWTEKPEILEDTDFLWQEKMYRDKDKKYRAVYLSNHYKTKIIWSIHPNRLGWLHFDKNDRADLIDFLADTYHLLSSEI